MTERILIGLIGANIMNSLSPAIMNDAFAALGISGFYHLMDVDKLREKRLPQLLDSIKAAGFAGTNITYPFKQKIMPLLDTLDPQATQVGAINTVAIAPDGRTTGYNFDRPGFRRSFEEGLGRDAAQGATVVMVGAGGAGRAVAFALMDLQVGTIVLHDTDALRAASLLDDLSQSYGASRCRFAGKLEDEIAAADGVVNCTPIGMFGFPGNPVPMAAITAEHWCADVIYTPARTEFIKAAADKGARTLGGGGMCIYQAVEAFRLFTGREPDIARMQHVFDEAIAARAAAGRG